MAKQHDNLCLTFNRVSADEFRSSVIRVMKHSPYHAENITLKPSYANDECWISANSTCGFAVTPEKELISVFSYVAGEGSALLAFSKSKYDQLYLNCFNSTFLRHFYEKNGFEVIRKEANWIAGKRDILFMEYTK